MHVAGQQHGISTELKQMPEPGLALGQRLGGGAAGRHVNQHNAALRLLVGRQHLTDFEQRDPRRAVLLAHGQLAGVAVVGVV